MAIKCCGKCKKQDMKKVYFTRIRGLGKNDRAHCGEYGIVRCVKAASETKAGRRQFQVTQSSKIANKRYDIATIREAIFG